MAHRSADKLCRTLKKRAMFEDLAVRLSFGSIKAMGRMLAYWRNVFVRWFPFACRLETPRSDGAQNIGFDCTWIEDRDFADCLRSCKHRASRK